MIDFKITKQEIERKELISKTCDRCKKTYRNDNTSFELYECQEFYHIRFTGGYGSVFGDEETVKIDLCQHCLLELVKDFWENKE